PGRRAAEDRRLRLDPFRRAALPGCCDADRAGRHGARGRGHSLRRRARFRAGRLQTARRIHEGEPPGLRPARHLRVERARAAGCDHGHDRTRAFDRRAVRGRRRASGTAAHAGHAQDGGPLAATAADGRRGALLRDRIARAAGPCELRRRVPRAARVVRRRAGRRGARRGRVDLRGSLLARADPAIVPRTGEKGDPRDGFRPTRDGVVRRDDRRARLARASAATGLRRGEADARGARRPRRAFRRRCRAVTFTSAHLVALLPIVVLDGAAIVVLLLAAFSPSRRVTTGATAIALAATLATLPIAARVIPLDVSPLIRIDGAALLYTGLLVACTLGVLGLSTAYLKGLGESVGELCILLVTAALGAAVLSASSHFASLFLGIELVSVSLFALLAYARDEKPNLEASLKYVILSGVSSAFLLFGIALVYTELGTLEFARIAELVPLESASSVYIARSEE